MPIKESWFNKLIGVSLASCLVGIVFFCVTTLFYVFLIEDVAVTAMYYGTIAAIVSAVLALLTFFFLDKHGGYLF